MTEKSKIFKFLAEVEKQKNCIKQKNVTWSKIITALLPSLEMKNHQVLNFSAATGSVLALFNLNTCIINLILFWSDKISVTQKIKWKYIEWNLPKTKLLGTSFCVLKKGLWCLTPLSTIFCVRNRQVFSLCRLN